MARVKIGNVRTPIEYLKQYFAPAGHGLGEHAPIITDLDIQHKCGWYNFGEGATGSPFPYGGALLVLSKGTSFIQLAFNSVSADWGGAGGIARRIGGEANWYEWEYINPPMMSGVEYRTVERWQGKAVYTKVLNCGSMPNASSAVVPHECAASAVIRCCGTTSLGTTIPYRWNDNYVSVPADRTNIHICTNTDFSTQTYSVQIWYTKD